MNEKLSLYELQLIIRDSLYIALPEMYWVTAEISEINENYAGHCFLELIEKQAGDKDVRARIKAIIWCKRYSSLKSYFESTTGESLRSGIKILVRVKLEYHELYGLSLIICDIDPSYTMGEQALRRQLIIRKLEEEGVFSMNREIQFPPVPQRIAIISSSSAAGYTDFMSHLSSNSFKYVFYTDLFESPMQGPETEQGIISALNIIAENAGKYDVVVLIRGGGSQSDLGWFDNYNIAYHITQFPLPVITGIGHEKDMSVADMVANVALKTPTAVADFLVENIVTFEANLMDLWTMIKEKGKAITENYRIRLESSGVRLGPLTRMMIGAFKESLTGKTIRIISYGKEYTRKAGLVPANQYSRLVSGIASYSFLKKIELEKSLSRLKTGSSGYIEKNLILLNQALRTLDILKPENVLQRGYTITYHNGSIVKRCLPLKKDDLISTRFIDGSVSSRIIDENNPELKNKDNE